MSSTDHLRRSPLVHLVDPPARQIGESGEVLRPGQPLGLEASHLAGRGGRPSDRPVADHPAHRRVAAQPVGVVHILVAGEPAVETISLSNGDVLPRICHRAVVLLKR
jgi:hypothetical protein